MAKPTSPSKPPSNKDLKPDPNQLGSRAPRWFAAVYWPFFAAVFVLLLVLMVRPLIFEQEFFGRNLQAVGMTVVIVCLALWIGDVLHYLYLSVGVRRAIFVPFISAILVAAGSYFVYPPGPPVPATPVVKRPVIRDLAFFNEDAVKVVGATGTITGLEKRQNTNFVFTKADPKLGLLVGFVVGNVAADKEGRVRLKSRLIFNSAAGLYDMYEVGRGTLAEWKTKGLLKQLDPSVVKSMFGGVKDTETVVLAHIQVDHRTVASGQAEIRVLVQDEIEKTWAEDVLKLSMAEQAGAAAEKVAAVTK